MARILQIGFELGSVANGVEITTVAGSPALETTIVRSGSYAARLSTSDEIRVTFAATDQQGNFYARFYLWVVTLPTATRNIFAFRDAANTAQVAVQLAADGTMILRNVEDGANVGSASPAISTGQWYLIEMRFDATTLASTAVEAKIDGVSFASGTVNMANGANQLWWLVSAADTNLDFVIDDVALNDGNGSFQNSWCGPGKIIYLRPNAAGDSNTFGTQVGGTAGAGNNYTRVSETTPDDASSYNASGTANQEDLFNFGSSGIAAIDKVNVVAVGARVANITAADATTAIKLELLKTSGGTKAQSGAIVPNSTTWRSNGLTTAVPPLVTYQDPDSADWTQSTLDSLQAGYLLSTANTRAIGVSALWVSVDYVPTQTKSIDGAVTSGATATKAVSAPKSGAVASAGSVLRSAQKAIAGTMTSAGTLVRSVSRNLSASLTSEGVLAKSGTTFFEGTLGLAGIGNKQSNRFEAGEIAGAGEIGRQTLKPMEGTLVTAGTLVRDASRFLDAALGLDGAFLKLTRHDTSGEVSPDGADTRQTQKAAGGEIASEGTHLNSISRTLTAALGLAGAVYKVAQIHVSGNLDSSGVVNVVRVILLALGGTLTTSGTIVKAIGKLILAALLFNQQCQRLPGTAVAVSAIGPGGWNRQWSNPNGAKTDNDDRASGQILAFFNYPNADSNDLRLTNFGFSIPTDAKITGVLTEIQGNRQGSSDPTVRVRVSLVKNTNHIGTPSYVDLTSSVDQETTAGGMADTWGLDLAPADVNDSTFGIALWLHGPDSTFGPYANIDVVRVTVYYELSHKDIFKPLAGVVAGAGAALRAAQKTLTGGIPFTGQIARVGQVVLGGTVTSVGEIRRDIGRFFAGLVDLVGTAASEINGEPVVFWKEIARFTVRVTRQIQLLIER